MSDEANQHDHLLGVKSGNWTIEDVRKAIPPHLHQRQTWRGLMYFFRDVAMVATLWYLATWIGPTLHHLSDTYELGPNLVRLLGLLLWSTYWVVQGLALTGLWVIAHECGHGSVSDNRRLCDSLGFVAHSFLLTPYFSWKISHHRHHVYHGSMERDVVYVPKTKSQTPFAHKDSVMEETPAYTLFRLVRRQVIALTAYLVWNATGQVSHPPTSNHFNPNARIFKPSQRNAILLSDLGIMAMLYLLRLGTRTWGAGNVIRFWGVPWLFVNHWVAMITYLHHTDPTLPHYRGTAWSFTRGAVATLDRDFLGWAGRFFFHDVSHYHIIHHLFPKMPFYNSKEATEYLKACIGDDYRRSDKPVFKAMWHNFNECIYVDDIGDTLFWRNRKGERAAVKP